jgi:hypothetical protein
MIVLGTGFVGSRILKYIPQAIGTSRQTSQSLKYFNLHVRDSWSVVNNFEDVVWTFPCATDYQTELMAIEFYKSKLIGKKVIVFGTTSCFETNFNQPIPIVNEKNELNQNIRTQTEEKLRLLGANILCLSGLWGFEKKPLNWVKKGLIKSSSGNVNLIHEIDIAKVVELFWNNSKMKSERINVSSGVCYSWIHLLRHYLFTNQLSQNEFDALALSQEKKPSKLVSNSKLKAYFPELKNYEFRSPFEL